VTIAVFLTAMVTILFSTLTGCRGCSSEEKEAHWVPAPRDTVPKVKSVVSKAVVDNFLNMEPVVEEIVTKPAKNKRPVSKYDNYNNKSQGSYRRQYKHTTNRSGYRELDPDSIKLTIIISDLEMQIQMQKSDEESPDNI
jgi:hypothetical protein